MRPLDAYRSRDVVAEHVKGRTLIENASASPSYVTLEHYARALRRRWWLLAVGLVLGGLIGSAYAASVTKQYTSIATVSVTPTGLLDTSSVSGTRTATAINMDNEVQLVTSPTVATGALGLLRTGGDPFQLVKHVSVTVRPNTALMDISFESAHPLAAQQGAHAFALAYLNQRRVNAQSKLDDQIAGLRSQIAQSSGQLKIVTAQIASLPANSPAKAYAAAQQSVLVSQLSTLQAKLSPLQITTITPGDILADAQLPTVATGLGRKVLQLGGVLIGLLLGLMLVSGAERLDRRVLSANDVDGGRLRVLARFKRSSGLRTVHVLAAESDGARTFAHLRNVVSKLAAADSGCTVLVTGAQRGDGASNVALNLAVALSRGGFETLLVCLRPGSGLPSAVGAVDTPSLTDIVRRVELERWLPVLPSLRIVATDIDTRSGGAVKTAALPALHRSLRHLAPYIVIDAQPLSQDADVQAWASIVDAVLLVAELRRTTVPAMDRAQELLSVAEPSLAGIVVVPRVRSGRYRRSNRVGDVPPGSDGVLSRSVAGSQGVDGTTPLEGAPHGQDDTVSRFHGAQ